MSAAPAFVDAWRRAKSGAFDLHANSTARGTRTVDFWGDARPVYGNANFSVYSAQSCNARCRFCVEELRPASRGRELSAQRTVERDDDVYFGALEASLDVLAEFRPSVSVTGGEPSIDPRLPRILRTLEKHQCRKRTVTTNGSGLLGVREGRRVVDWIASTGVAHLNISRAHADTARNAELMRLADGLDAARLAEAISAARAGGVRPRLSCVLLHEANHTLESIVDYIRFARDAGADNVIFRQLMLTDAATAAENDVVRYCDASRERLEPLLDAISGDSRFTFVRQIVGYYYYVEVWRFEDSDVVFEEADLARLEDVKRNSPGVVHELIFHPNARLASTWQPWDGVLGPKAGAAPRAMM